MTTGGRKWVMGFALALTLAATAWVSTREEAGTPAGVERKAGASRPPGSRTSDRSLGIAAAELQLDKLNRPSIEEGTGDMFPAAGWQPPPPPPGSVKAEPPKAPPLPFRYFGQMVEDGVPVVFLERGARNFTVRQGDNIDGTYRVDQIRNDAVLITYVPLDLKQTLSIGPMK
jgi:hypothetical protein